MPFGFLDPNDCKIIWLSHFSVLSVFKKKVIPLNLISTEGPGGSLS